MVRQAALAGLAFAASTAFGAPAAKAVTPAVKGSPQVLGVAMDSYLNRDSCGSARFNDRAFWTCRDTQNFNSDGSVQVAPLYSSSASWSNFGSDGRPTLYPGNVYHSTGGLPVYGSNNNKPFFPILPEDCGDNTAGSCSDGTRFAIWPDSPPMPVSSSSSGVTAYTWIRRFHIRGDLSTVQNDPPTTLYKVKYTAGQGAQDSLPAVSVVNKAFYNANEIPYGNYGNVVKDGTAYLWGKPSNNKVALAKVPVGAVEDHSQYQYYVNGAWTKTKPGMNDNGIEIPNTSAGGQGTYYYSDAWKSYVWIGQAGLSVSADFFITTAPAPQGPWATPQKFYSGVNGNFSLGAYSLQAHPALVQSGKNEIYLTYTKNDLINNVNVYTTPLIYVQWQ